MQGVSRGARENARKNVKVCGGNMSVTSFKARKNIFFNMHF